MKEEILQTSLNQFMKYGIREMSIQKLIEPLGISTKTVYKYFKNKEELLQEALIFQNKQNVADWKAIFDTLDTVSLFFNIWYIAVEAESNINKLFYHDLHRYYPELHKKNEAELETKYKKQFIQIIKKGVQEKLFHDDIIPEVVFEGISIFFKAITREGQFEGFNISSYNTMFNTIGVYIRGCCTPKGVKKLEEHILTLDFSQAQSVFQNAGFLAQ